MSGFPTKAWSLFILVPEPPAPPFCLVRERRLSLALVFLALTTPKPFRFLRIEGKYYPHFPEENPITDFFCDPWGKSFLAQKDEVIFQS